MLEKVKIYLAKNKASLLEQAILLMLESGPMGSSHATRGWGLLVAATRSSWRLLVAARSP
jgi:hypothetical protein